MKFKSLLLTAAITAASLSSVAHAAIDIGTQSEQSNNSDLVLVISDAVLNLGYVQVLDGFNYLSIVNSAKAGTFGASFNLDAAALNIFSGSNRSNLLWSFATTNVNDDVGEVTGNIMTMASPYIPVDPTNGPGMDSSLLATVGNKFWNLATNVNATTAIGTGALAASGGVGTQIATQANIWNANVSYTFGINTSAKPNTAQNLWWSGTAVDFMAVKPSIASISPYMLDLDAKTLAPAPVPLPAAAWLLVSALMGLGGIARRRNATV